MNNIVIEVNKRFELVQVLVYLTDRQEKTYQFLDNAEYFPALQEYFQKFTTHEAVKITTDLIDNQNFVHVIPFKAILNIDEIIKNTEHPLYNWVNSVKDFERESRFDDFFDSNNNREYFSTVVNTAKAFGIEKWLDYTEKFFRKEFNRFILILSPSIGNYGFIMDVPEKETAYTVRLIPYCDENGKRNWNVGDFARGIAHEFAHCFVNPVVEKHKNKLDDLSAFFKSHKDMLSFYNVNYAVMNEYYVRAYSILFMKKFRSDFPDFDIKADTERHKKQAGFIYIDDFIAYLDEYESSNMSFEDFCLSKLNEMATICN